MAHQFLDQPQTAAAVHPAWRAPTSPVAHGHFHLMLGHVATNFDVAICGSIGVLDHVAARFAAGHQDLIGILVVRLRRLHPPAQRMPQHRQRRGHRREPDMEPGRVGDFRTQGQERDVVPAGTAAGHLAQHAVHQLIQILIGIRGGGAMQARQAIVDRRAAHLDQSVGVEEECAAGPQLR